MTEENQFLFWYLGRNECGGWTRTDWFKLRSQKFNTSSE